MTSLNAPIAVTCAPRSPFSVANRNSGSFTSSFFSNTSANVFRPFWSCNNFDFILMWLVLNRIGSKMRTLTSGILISLRDTTGEPLKPVYKLMGDPRNVAHAKKVTQEKHHKAKHAQKSGAPQPDKKAQVEETKSPAAERSAVEKTETGKPAQSPDSAHLEKSLAVLSTLKDLEFHSRSNIEKLAELSLTIEEELKQKEFA